MTRTVYLNGEYFSENEAKISIFDRGFLMADAVYEVTSVLDGKLIDFKGHADRLNRSLDELGMKNPIPYEELLAIHRELVRLHLAGYSPVPSCSRRCTDYFSYSFGGYY